MQAFNGIAFSALIPPKAGNSLETEADASAKVDYHGYEILHQILHKSNTMVQNHFQQL
jgi:hypothetical protein